MCGINAVGAQGSGCMLALCHAPLKMAVLLHKTGNVCRVMITSVYGKILKKEDLQRLAQTCMTLAKACTMLIKEYKRVW